jgi:hypothetical protein
VRAPCLTETKGALISNQNEELVCARLDAYCRGDFKVSLAVFAPNVELVNDPTVPGLGTTFHGRKSPATVTTGRDPIGIAVTPLPRVPTTKEQCKDGGWEQFGFKYQGQCLAFVNRGPQR